MPTEVFEGRFAVIVPLTSAERALVEPYNGEPCRDPDTNRLYIGDGGVWVEHVPTVTLDAADAEYTPVEPDDWVASPPDNAADALDELAARIELLEASPGGTRVFYDEINTTGTSSGSPYIIALDTDQYDVAIIAVTASSGPGYVRLPGVVADMYGKRVEIWNLAGIGILTVQSETAITINTLNPPYGGAEYTCVGAGGYQWRPLTGTDLYIPKSALTAKGQILVATGSGAYTPLVVGSNGQVLTADSAETSGVKWATGSGGSMDIDGLTAEADVNHATDYIPMRDVSASANRKVLARNILRLAPYTQSGTTIDADNGLRQIRSASADISPTVSNLLDGEALMWTVTASGADRTISPPSGHVAPRSSVLIPSGKTLTFIVWREGSAYNWDWGTFRAAI